MEPKPRGRKTCSVCTPIVHEAFVARRKAREGLRRKPCADCGGVKGFGNGKGIYCARCREKRNARPRCHACGVNPIRGHAKQLCEGCWLKSRETERARRRAQDARRRDRAQPKAARVHRPDRAAARMRYRLQREREGSPVEPAPSIVTDRNRARVDASGFPNLPSAPLVAMVDRLIDREAAGPFVKGSYLRLTGETGQELDLKSVPRDDAPSPTEAVCDRLGITSKTVREWRDGRRPTVRFDVADKVITRAEVCWWDVWSEGEAYEMAMYAFTGERAA